MRRKSSSFLQHCGEEEMGVSTALEDLGSPSRQAESGLPATLTSVDAVVHCPLELVVSALSPRMRGEL